MEKEFERHYSKEKILLHENEKLKVDNAKLEHEIESSKCIIYI